MRLFPALALSASLLAGACTNQYGEPDPGATLGLVAGAAALGGLAYVVSQSGDDDKPRARQRGRDYRRADYDRRGSYRRW